MQQVAIAAGQRHQRGVTRRLLIEPQLGTGDGHDSDLLVANAIENALSGDLVLAHRRNRNIFLLEAAQR